jgi:hypothetical protein
VLSPSISTFETSPVGFDVALFTGDGEKKMRKSIFDTIRAQHGKGFTAEEVKAIDALLDRLGVEQDVQQLLARIDAARARFEPC